MRCGSVLSMIVSLAFIVFRMMFILLMAFYCTARFVGEGGRWVDE